MEPVQEGQNEKNFLLRRDRTRLGWSMMGTEEFTHAQQDPIPSLPAA